MKTKKTTKTTAERFAALVAPPDENGCTTWLGSTRGSHARRGQFRDEQRTIVYAHRWAWEATNGPIPPGHDLRRTCPEPLCVNPEHWQPAAHMTALEQRFLARVEPDGDHLRWTGTLDKEGYPSMNLTDGRPARAHRIGYALWYGRTPKRRHIHHACERKDCVAPWHLEEHPKWRHRRIHERQERAAKRQQARLQRLTAKLARRWPRMVELLTHGPSDPALVATEPRPASMVGAGPISRPMS